MRLSRLFPVAVLVAFTALFFWKLAFSTEYSILCLQDWGIRSYPWLHFAAYEIRHNHALPLWDPFSYSGHNFVGEPQAGVFYPWNWLLYLAPFRNPLSVDRVHFWILLSFVAGAWGMYRCARQLGLDRTGSLVAGLAFMFSGYMARQAAQQINVFHGALWLPVVFLFFLRALRQRSVRQQFKFTLLAGAAWGMSFLAGHHEPGLYIGLGIGFWTALYCLRPCYAVGRKSAAVLLAFLVVCAFLAAALQLFPSYQYSKTAYRWAGEAFAPGRQIPMPQLESTQQVEPRSLFSLVFPVTDAKGESDIYFGILPLLLAIFGFRRSRKLETWRFAALAGFSLLYSFSGFSVLHGLLLSVAPVLRMGRESIRMLALFHFSLALLAGAGAQKLASDLKGGDRKTLGRLCRGWGFLVAIAGVMLVALTLVSVLKLSAAADVLDSHLSRLYYCWLMMFLALGLLLWRLARRRASPFFAGVIFIAMLLDLSPANTTAILPRSGVDFKANYYPEAVYGTPELMHFVETLKGEGRWLDETGVFTGNFQLIHRIRATLGYSATAPVAYMDYYWKGGRRRDQLNVRYEFSRDAQGKATLTERPGAIPRFQLTRNVRIVSDNVLDQWLKGDEYEPNAVLVDPPERDKLPDDIVMLSRRRVETEGAVRLLWENNRRIELEVTTTLSAFLLTSETYDEGWSAYIDKREAPVVKCNGVLRGIWVPAGSHSVSFRYIPKGLLQGASISMLYWLSVAAALYLFPGSRRKG